METNSDHDRHALAQERAIMKEWNYVQQSLFNFPPTILRAPLATRRQLFQQCIERITETRSRIWWEAFPTGSPPARSRLVEMCYQRISYGFLELADGYLESTLIPKLPQHFADLCALLLYTAEHVQFVAHHLAQLPPLVARGARVQLTPREKDVLIGLIRWESEEKMAARLGIAKPSVHTHIGRLYTKLHVESAPQAIYRSFELRLVDWLGRPAGDENAQK